MIYFDELDIEATEEYMIKSDKKGGKSTKHRDMVGKITISGGITVGNLMALTDALNDMYANSSNRVLYTVTLRGEGD